MQKQISPKITALTFGILAVSFLAAFYVVAWQEPTASPPSDNVPTPLNVGNLGQSKEGGLILNTGGAEYGLIVSQGESEFESITIIGGTSLPTCDSSYRGKMFLLQSGSGTTTEDGLYICKKKIDNTYRWVGTISASSYPPVACPEGSAIRVINTDGSVVCEVDDAGGGASAPGTTCSTQYTDNNCNESPKITTCDQACTAWGGWCTSAVSVTNSMTGEGTGTSCGDLVNGYCHYHICNCCKSK